MHGSEVDLGNLEDLLQSQGPHTVVGYGSLLNGHSVKHSFPGSSGFRAARVNGFVRIFNKVGVVFLEQGMADVAAGKMASCSTERHRDHHLLVSLFEISSGELAIFFEREHRFRFITVEAITRDGRTQQGIMCTRYDDPSYRSQRCGNEDEYQRRVGQFYQGQLWRDDLLPCTPYLRYCLEAAGSMGPEVYENFLDHSLLGDRQTSIRHYLQREDLNQPQQPLPQRYQAGNNARANQVS